ncbi:ribosome silencing factor [Isachenkonia alkalipeptolytica]|uniref:Ribosomal silencing factor RsfS n=1 Tax=Isachenkonia alkalipeptolytica TaxID=2565777 RepID=A0AA43XLA5_9CLOT|nr:ribosome silencing factor [Isachenkonia alkalipeptolytica]NBG88938.1 ribosome silencing factor [Isachenkonia alkalipeptolytica]
MAESPKKLVKRILEVIDDKIGEDTSVIDLESVSTIADYFVLTNGESLRQTKVLADEIIEQLEEDGIFLRNKEGYQTGKWILLDYGDIVVHIFEKETREFYDLEKIWQDAKIISVTEGKPDTPL